MRPYKINKLNAYFLLQKKKYFIIYFEEENHDYNG